MYEDLKQTMTGLHGKTAVVTGAASGIGAATAWALAAAGAKIALADIDAAGARDGAERLRRAGAEAIDVHVDVADESQVPSAIRRIVHELGTVDILHNNAAALAWEHMQQDGDVHEIDREFWDRTMAVNLSGCFLFTKHALPHMLEQGAGVIVNTSSVGGLLGDGRPAYGTTKAGIISFTRNVAMQYGKRGIRCVAIAPGLILTEGAQTAPQSYLTMMLRHHLTPTLGRPEDIANMVSFLASDAAAFITGVTIPVDGGLSVHEPHWADEVALHAGGEL